MTFIFSFAIIDILTTERPFIGSEKHWGGGGWLTRDEKINGRPMSVCSSARPVSKCSLCRRCRRRRNPERHLCHTHAERRDSTSHPLPTVVVTQWESDGRVSGARGASGGHEGGRGPRVSAAAAAIGYRLLRRGYERRTGREVRERGHRRARVVPEQLDGDARLSAARRNSSAAATDRPTDAPAADAEDAADRRRLPPSPGSAVG